MNEPGFNEFYDTPVQVGQMRVIWCTKCGAITSLIGGDNEVTGDHDLHVKWHEENGH